MKRILSLFILIIILFAVVGNGQGTQIRNLPSASAVNSGDMFPGDAFAGGTYKYTFSQLLGARTITCAAPLLCAGGASMDLSADRVLSISPAVLTSTTNGGPVRWSTTGSTITGATNEGLRNAMFTLFDTSTSDVDNAVLMIDSIQTTNASAACIKRTGLHVKTYTLPDNGCDTSSALIVQSGGGSGISVYKLHTLRPSGFTDYSSSIQGAIEAGTNDQSQAGLFMSGINIGGVATNSSTAILARVDNSTSRGVVIQPNDNIFDTRDALIVGTAQINAAPINQKFSLKMNGNLTTVGTISAGGAVSGSNLSGTNTGDQVVPVNTAATGSNWFSAYNSATGAYTKSQPAMADLSDAATWKGWTKSGAAVSTTVSTDKVGIGTAAPNALLSVSANATNLPSILAGTVVQIGQVDGAANRIGMYAFASPSVIDFVRADTTATSPSALQANDLIGQITGSGYDGTSYPSVTNIAIQYKVGATWTNSSHPTFVGFVTTPVGSTTAVESMRLDSTGHLLLLGAAPTVACTGTGTSPSAPTIDSGGTDLRFTVTVNTGTGSPGSTGTCTVTFATAFSAVRPVVCMLVKGTAAWGNGATIQETTESASAPVFTWTNLVGGVATALTVSTSYKFSCITIG